MNSFLKPTKSFSCNGLTIGLVEQVYDPAEDSFFLLEFLSKYGVKDLRVVEVGCGCGLVSLECARLGADVVGIDCNPYAVKLSFFNAVKNKEKLNGSFEFLRGNCLDALGKSKLFDLVVCNPPYLPICGQMSTDDWIGIACEGGNDGLKLTKRLFVEAKEVLADNGKLLVIVSSLSPVSKCLSFAKSCGWCCEIASELSLGNDETLLLLSCSLE